MEKRVPLRYDECDCFHSVSGNDSFYSILCYGRTITQSSHNCEKRKTNWFVSVFISLCLSPGVCCCVYIVLASSSIQLESVCRATESGRMFVMHAWWIQVLFSQLRKIVDCISSFHLRFILHFRYLLCRRDSKILSKCCQTAFNSFNSNHRIILTIVEGLKHEKHKS